MTAAPIDRREVLAGLGAAASAALLPASVPAGEIAQASPRFAALHDELARAIAALDDARRKFRDCKPFLADGRFRRSKEEGHSWYARQPVVRTMQDCYDRAWDAFYAVMRAEAEARSAADDEVVFAALDAAEDSLGSLTARVCQSPSRLGRDPRSVAARHQLAEQQGWACDGDAEET